MTPEMQHDIAACGMFYVFPFLFIILWIIALADIAGNRNLAKRDKNRWLAFVLIASPIAVPVYFFVSRFRKKAR